MSDDSNKNNGFNRNNRSLDKIFSQRNEKHSNVEKSTTNATNNESTETQVSPIVYQKTDSVSDAKKEEIKQPKVQTAASENKYDHLKDEVLAETKKLDQDEKAEEKIFNQELKENTKTLEKKKVQVTDDFNFANVDSNDQKTEAKKEENQPVEVKEKKPSKFASFWKSKAKKEEAKSNEITSVSNQEKLEEKVTAEKIEETPEKKKFTDKERKNLKKVTNTAREQKKAQKASFKALSKEDRDALKERAKNVEKLNKAHHGPKEIALSGDNIIELKDVVKFYSNGYVVTQILKGVNLEIKRGDFVIILGPSGSGKTTLMNIISGLDRASDGVTNVCGTNLINLKDNELTKFRRDNVGYVFQQYGLLPNLTVRENVEIGANLQVDKSKKLDVFEVLESVDMLMHKDKFPHQLSGGQQQRVSIARAFAKNPTILFGDEPTGAIDEEMSKMVLKEFVRINKEHKTTVIIVTHNPIFEGLGSLVVKIKDGNIGSLIRNEHPLDVDDLPWGQD